MTETLERLDAGTSSLLIAVTGGEPRLAYLGPGLTANPPASELAQLLHPPIPHGELDRDRWVALYPVDDGIPGHYPALAARREGAARLIDLQLREMEHAGDSLHLRQVDPRLDLLMDLTIRGTQSGVFEYEVTLTNRGKDALEITRLASLHLNLPSRYAALLRSGGYWANELQARRETLGDSALLVESDRGRSSHGSTPALLLGEAGFSEERGELVATALCWSGNHRLRANRSRDGGAQLTVEVPLRGGDLVLEPGAVHSAAPGLFAHSSAGMNGIREQFRRYWAARHPVAEEPAPVYFNSWEARYFDHDEGSSRALVDAAAELGAERFVLDDGWMAGRTGSGVGLGDWLPCPERYPRGLRPIAEHARARGLDFGLWIEPEMVTADAAVAAEHPEWLIAAPGLTPVTGREQSLLDVARPAVRDYLLRRITALVEDCAPAFIKWDMNRDYAHTGVECGSTAFALSRGYEALMEAVRAQFPAITLEICSSGGARSDCGALRHAARLWPSDSMDPLQRFAALRTASLWLPLARLGSHVGASPSSTSGRSTPFGTRCAIALLGQFGIELDPAELSDTQRSELAAWVDRYRQHRDWLSDARRLFLDTHDEGLDAALAVSASDESALLWLLRQFPARRNTVGTLRVPGLSPDKRYRIKLLNPEACDFAQTRPALHRGEISLASGEILERVGLRLPLLQAGHCALFEFTSVD